MWKCTKCEELVDDGFEVCWKCRHAKPPSPALVSEAYEPAARWAGNFVESKQPDGSVAVEVFGRGLTCAVCGNMTFREHTAVVTTALVGRSAMNFVCSRCGNILWFLPQ